MIILAKSIFGDQSRSFIEVPESSAEWNFTYCIYYHPQYFKQMMHWQKVGVIAVVVVVVLVRLVILVASAILLSLGQQYAKHKAFSRVSKFH